MFPTIPRDFPVRPLRADAPAGDRMTCGTCGLSWDDSIPTSYTPAPSGRCPFEHFHADGLRYSFRGGRWHYSDNDGATWTRTRYNVRHAPEPQYREANPKLDLFTRSGRYVGSTNWHRTCRDAFAWFATRHPEKEIVLVQRDPRR